MRLDDIRNLTRKVPFQPFRVYLSNGSTFDIFHPDMILATSGAAHISVASDNGPDHVKDQAVIVSLYHIQKIEPLPRTVVPSPPRPRGSTPAWPATHSAPDSRGARPSTGSPSATRSGSSSR
ncbi:MAG TPA: hypothetical protein VD866_10055 [Urbifossiella sp.]|nr:hypothetical protein [Urbifossiella sp.]